MSISYQEAVEIFYGKKYASTREKLEANRVYLMEPPNLGDVAMQRITQRAISNMSGALLMILGEEK